jgi:RNA recognition motif-containing protein
MNDIALHKLFSAYGTVLGAKVLRDHVNGRSRGFGFVIMSSSAEMEKAIAMLDGCVSNLEFYCFLMHKM